MKVDTFLSPDPKAAQRDFEQAVTDGFDGAWVAETAHDPFVACARACSSRADIEIGTSVAIAFARTPMSTAVMANDIQELTGGKFILGLGSQVKAHIERRFSMPWSHPAARMREYVMAMRAVWESWRDGAPLRFKGDFYTHTLMPPFFNPGPGDHNPPRVFLAGVGERMTEVAGEVGDGFICHPFTTERYLREVTLPALGRGRAADVQGVDPFEVSFPTFVVTGESEQQFEAACVGTRNQIAFYGSTPAYRRVLELHGWGDLQGELHALSVQGRWTEMGGLIEDDVLRTFAVVGTPDVVAPEIVRRFGGCVTRISLNTPYEVAPAAIAQIRAALQSELAS